MRRFAVPVGARASRAVAEARRLGSPPRASRWVRVSETGESGRASRRRARRGA
jgi:hypothetical protein